MITLYSGTTLPLNLSVNYLCPECKIHPIKQLEWVYDRDLTKDFSVFTHSPYIYEALIRYARSRDVPITYYHEEILHDSGVKAMESFSEPFDVFDKEDENRFQGLS